MWHYILDALTYLIIASGFLASNETTPPAPPPLTLTLEEPLSTDKKESSSTDVETSTPAEARRTLPLKYVDLGGTTVSCEDVSLVFTTLPSALFVPTSAFDSRTECLFLSAVATEKIFGTPGYPRSIPSPRQPGAFRTGSTPHMGLGMFAARDLSVGELILCERPLMIAPLQLKFALDQPAEHVAATAGEELDTALHEVKTIFGRSFMRMSAANQAAFLSLSNEYSGSDMGVIFGVIKTNGIVLPALEEDGSQYVAVCNEMSRINHSCAPNLTRVFDLASLTFQLSVVRPIAKDDQLFISYIDASQPFSERQKALARYNFRCRCSSCSRPKETDAIRDLASTSSATIDALIIHWLANPSLPDNFIIDRCLEMTDVMGNEGLQSLDAHKAHFRGAFAAALAMGDGAAVHSLAMALVSRFRVDLPEGEGSVDELLSREIARAPPYRSRPSSGGRSNYLDQLRYMAFM